MNERNEECYMTDLQAKRADALARIDEINRAEEHTNDPAMLQYLAERKKELRAIVDAH